MQNRVLLVDRIRGSGPAVHSGGTVSREHGGDHLCRMGPHVSGKIRRLDGSVRGPTVRWAYSIGQDTPAFLLCLLVWSHSTQQESPIHPYPILPSSLPPLLPPLSLFISLQDFLSSSASPGRGPARLPGGHTHALAGRAADPRGSGGGSWGEEPRRSTCVVGV